MPWSTSVCVLCFGDYPHLAQRCLQSIKTAVTGTEAGVAAVRDFRLVANEVSPVTDSLISRFAAEMWAGYRIPSRIFRVPRQFEDPNNHVAKYPLMRRMFFSHEPLASAVMWFDDDSYFEPVLPANWWQDWSSRLDQADVLGQFWLMPIRGNQWQWIQSQRWYNPRVGLPPKKVRGKPAFEFCQGGWWISRSQIIQKYDWPSAEIRHNGGDSMFGELCRHQGLRMCRFHTGLRINADALGRHSKAARRGLGENNVGWNYSGQPLPQGHQQFIYQTELISGY